MAGRPQPDPRGALDREIVADRIVHAVGLAGGVAGGAVLLAMAATTADVPLFPVAVYVAGLLAMLACSAAYHVWKQHRHRDWLRRLDHAAIFVMIAGTYTPIAALALHGPWATAVLAAVWSLAGVGVALKLARPRFIEPASIALYLLQGWIGLFALAELLRALPAWTLSLIVAGGLVYSAGTLIHTSSRRYSVALWHGCVLLGAGLHYIAIASLIA
jgi:hemolysin III